MRLAPTLLLLAFLGTPIDQPQPANRWWACKTTLKKEPKSGRVCAKNERDAIDECGIHLCDLDMVCQTECSCSATQDACAP